MSLDVIELYTCSTLHVSSMSSPVVILMSLYPIMLALKTKKCIVIDQYQNHTPKNSAHQNSITWMIPYLPLCVQVIAIPALLSSVSIALEPYNQLQPAKLLRKQHPECVFLVQSSSQIV